MTEALVGIPTNLIKQVSILISVVVCNFRAVPASPNGHPQLLCEFPKAAFGAAGMAEVSALRNLEIWLMRRLPLPVGMEWAPANVFPAGIRAADHPKVGKNLSQEIGFSCRGHGFAHSHLLLDRPPKG